MQSIFRYPGGKTREAVRSWILGLRPGRVRDYREPFVGGGGVFFALKPGEGERWINDRNDGLVAVYRALAERPGEFIERCRATEPARDDDPMTEPGVRGGKPANARLKAEFDRVAFGGETDPAYRYFFINRTVFGGRVNYDRQSRLYFSNPAGWEVVRPGRLEKAAERLQGVRVTCGDFEPLFDDPGKDVWIYADPPYYCNTQFHGSSQLYQHSFTVADHRRLAEVFRRCKHPVALSYDDDEEGFIRGLYAGFRIEENTWAYSGSTNAEKDRGRELLILNYDPPERGMPLFVAVPRKAGEVEKVEPLSEAEAEELARCEAELERCTPPPFTTGKLLLAIRAKRLYRGHGTFETYCRQRWGMTKSRANQLIDAVLVADVLTTNCCQTPKTESQARELATLRTPEGNIDADRVTAMWDQVQKRAEQTGKKITAELIRKEVHRDESGPIDDRPAPAPTRVDVLARKFESLTERERTEFLQRIGVRHHERSHPVLPSPVGDHHEQPAPFACGDPCLR